MSSLDRIGKTDDIKIEKEEKEEKEKEKEETEKEKKEKKEKMEEKKKELRDPLLFITFYNVDIVQRSLQSMIKFYDHPSELPYDIYMLENPSDNTPDMEKYILDMMKQGWVKAYYRSTVNIAANIIYHFYRKCPHLFETDYVIVTEGDVDLEEGTHQEAISILNNKDNSDLGLCSVEFNLCNLPRKIYPECDSWVPPVQAVRSDCTIGNTGYQYLVFRTSVYKLYMEHVKVRELVMDTDLYNFLLRHSLKWGRTKLHKLIHLTWDIYADPDHPYNALKAKLRRDDTLWRDDKTARLDRIAE